MTHPRPFRIRDAVPGDAAPLAELHVAAFRETHGRAGAPSFELRESQWRAAFERETDWFCYVAEAQDGKLIGFAKGTLHDGGIPEFEGELDKIYVLRRWHRHGFGRRLVELNAAPSVSTNSHRRGAVLVGAALGLVFLPMLATIRVAQFFPNAIPALLVAGTLIVGLLAACYRGHRWARWIIVAFMVIRLIRALEGFARHQDTPGWLDPVEILWSLSILTLLFAPSSRGFLVSQSARRRQLPSRPAE